jgi:hypothetical protein
MKKEDIKEEILIISRQKNNVKGKLISFSLGMNENNTDQNSFRTINGLKFKTTKSSPDKTGLINEDKKIFEQVNISQKETDEFLKQQLIRKKELFTLKRKNLSNSSKKDSNNKTNINNNDSSSNQNTISYTSLLSPKKIKKLELTPLTSLRTHNKLIIKNKSPFTKIKYKPYLIESNYSNYVKYVIDGFYNNPTFVGRSNLFNSTMNKSKNTKSIFNNLNLKNLTEEKNNYRYKRLNSNNSLMLNDNKSKIQIKSIKIKNNFKKSNIHNS